MTRKRLQFVLPLEDYAFGRATFSELNYFYTRFVSQFKPSFLYARNVCDNGTNCATRRKTLKEIILQTCT